MDLPKPGPTGFDCPYCGKPTTWYGYVPGVDCRPCGKMWVAVCDAETFGLIRFQLWDPVLRLKKAENK